MPRTLEVPGVPLRGLPNIEDLAGLAAGELVDQLLELQDRERARGATRRRPRLGAAREVAEDRVPADPPQLHGCLIERTLVRYRQHHRCRERQQPTDVRGEGRLERDAQGPGHVSPGE